MKRLVLFLLPFLCITPQSHSTQRELKAKGDSSASHPLPRNQLQALPRDIQGMVKSYLIQPSPAIKPAGQKSNTLRIDYRLVPALLSYKPCAESIKHVLKVFQVTNDILPLVVTGGDRNDTFTREYRPYDLEAIPEDMFAMIKHRDTVETYVSARHTHLVQKLSLEQIDFIADLFATKQKLQQPSWRFAHYFWDRICCIETFPTKIYLNRADTKIFYSLPLSMQKNLLANYPIVISWVHRTKEFFSEKMPRLAAGLAYLGKLYTKYDAWKITHVAKTAVQTALVYCGLNKLSTIKVFKNYQNPLAKIVAHPKKLLVGIFALLNLPAIANAGWRYINQIRPMIKKELVLNIRPRD